MSKNRKADKILQALLSHRTHREAAKAAGVSERVLYDYLKDPDFSERLQAASDDILRGITSDLQGQMSKAVSVIAEIMSDTENAPKDRLTAARLVLEYGTRTTTDNEISERLRVLESIAIEAQEL